MKKLVILILAFCLVLPAFSVFASAAAPERSDEFKRLWEWRQNEKMYQTNGRYYDIDIEGPMPPLYYGEMCAVLLLYMPNVKGLTVSKRETPSSTLGEALKYCHDFEGEGCGYTGDVLYKNSQFTIYSPELGKITEYCYSGGHYDEKQMHIIGASEDVQMPLMRTVVKELQISLDDLLNAYNTMKTDPMKIKEIVPGMNDSEVEKFLIDIDFEKISNSNQYDFSESLLKLLYAMWSIESDEEARALLLGENKAIYNGSIVGSFDVLDEAEKYMTSGAQTVEFRDFLKSIVDKSYYYQSYLKESETNPIYAQKMRNFHALLAYANELPQTGDATPVYLAVAAVSGAVLLSAAMIRRKKKFD